MKHDNKQLMQQLNDELDGMAVTVMSGSDRSIVDLATEYYQSMGVPVNHILDSDSDEVGIAKLRASERGDQYQEGDELIGKELYERTHDRGEPLDEPLWRLKEMLEYAAENDPDFVWRIDTRVGDDPEVTAKMKATCKQIGVKCIVTGIHSERSRRLFEQFKNGELKQVTNNDLRGVLACCEAEGYGFGVKVSGDGESHSDRVKAICDEYDANFTEVD